MQQTTELRRLQDQYGPQAGALAWYSQFHGEQTLGMMRSKFGSEAEDLYANAVEKLFAAEDTSTVGMILSADERRIGKWIQTDAARRMSSNSRQKGDRERENTRYGLEGEDYIADSGRAVEEIAEQRLDTKMAWEAFMACERRPEHMRAFVMRHEDGESLETVAEYLGLKSRQAADQLLTRIGKDLRKNLDAILEGRACPEVASLLSAVAWMPGELDDLQSRRVSAHLDHCSTCAALVAEQRRSIPKALALFPAPLLILTQHASPIAHAVDAAKGLAVRGHDTAATATANAGSWQGAKPIAAAAAVAALLAGGTAYTVKQAQPEKPRKTAEAAAGPHRLVDPVTVPAVKRAKAKKHHKKKTATSTPATPTPTPTPTPVATQKLAQSVGDGSSEFLPEERGAP